MLFNHYTFTERTSRCYYFHWLWNGIPYNLFGKLLLKSKVIYVCSAADVYTSSRTPKRAYKYSDLFCVQWKEMLKVFPKAKYIGVL